MPFFNGSSYCVKSKCLTSILSASPPYPLRHATTRIAIRASRATVEQLCTPSSLLPQSINVLVLGIIVPFLRGFLGKRLLEVNYSSKIGKNIFSLKLGKVSSGL
jgi:hypothetical protein